ncbi:hypothetical protein OG613_26190 [Streptomyces sp. NBC_00015]|uniref:hypothetical protein n=1 Tax=unclassified Streptomyces TaxID=2593676 RepID=UPI00324F76A3
MRNRLAILAAAAVLPLTAAVSLAAATQAGANPNSPVVTVTGSVEDCPNGTTPNKVTITTNAESRTDKTDVDDTGEYSIKFTKITKAGNSASVTVNCGTASSYKGDSFKIKRPADANSTTQEHDIEAP